MKKNIYLKLMLVLCSISLSLIHCTQQDSNGGNLPPVANAINQPTTSPTASQTASDPWVDGIKRLQALAISPPSLTTHQLLDTHEELVLDTVGYVQKKIKKLDTQLNAKSTNQKLLQAIEKKINGYNQEFLAQDNQLIFYLQKTFLDINIATLTIEEMASLNAKLIQSIHHFSLINEADLSRMTEQVYNSIVHVIAVPFDRFRYNRYLQQMYKTLNESIIKPKAISDQQICQRLKPDELFSSEIKEIRQFLLLLQTEINQYERVQYFKQSNIPAQQNYVNKVSKIIQKLKKRTLAVEKTKQKPEKPSSKGSSIDRLVEETHLPNACVDSDELSFLHSSLGIKNPPSP